MGVRLGGTGQLLKRTANLPTSTSFCIAGWVKIRSLRATAYQYFFALENTAATSYHDLGYNNAASPPLQINRSTSPFYYNYASNPPLNTWLYIYIMCSGTGANLYSSGFKQHSDVNFTTVVGTGLSFATNQLTLGNDVVDEWCNVDLRGIRVWDVALTDAELKAEALSTKLVKSANINGAWDLPSTADVTDSSGNGRNLTVGGTLANSDDEPVIYTPLLIVPRTNYNTLLRM